MKIGVILSGCGFFDGSEINEAVLTLLAVSRLGHEAVCMAPDIEQKQVINHLTGKEMPEKRNVLIESSRIARGKIRDIKQVKASELDALIIPGGFGAAKNLSSFAFDGAKCTVQPDTAEFIREIHKSGKPIGAICISPALIAKIFESTGVSVTIGHEKESADEIRKLGNVHVECGVFETVVDAKNKIVTTPAYMLAKNISEAADGIEKLVSQVVSLAVSVQG